MQRRKAGVCGLFVKIVLNLRRKRHIAEIAERGDAKGSSQGKQKREMNIESDFGIWQVNRKKGESQMYTHRRSIVVRYIQ